MIFGFVVPALVQELSLLRECIDNLHSACKAIPSTSPRIVVLLQGALETIPDWLLNDPVIDLQLLPSKGVSHARNLGLARLETSSERLMFVDVSVRPSSDFLRGALLALSNAPIVSAPICFGDHDASHSADVIAVTQVSAVKVAFRAFIWSTAFRTDAIVGLRFDESIGPGTDSPHQAGEDGRFLYLVIMRNKLKKIQWLAHCPVRRLPRPDLSEKIKRYAHGQGFLLGQQIRAEGWSVKDRIYLLWRALLFFANSIRMFLGSSNDRLVSKIRLFALLAGVKSGKDNVKLGL
jgi:hypothetical protein